MRRIKSLRKKPVIPFTGNGQGTCAPNVAAYAVTQPVLQTTQTPSIAPQTHPNQQNSQNPPPQQSPQRNAEQPGEPDHTQVSIEKVEETSPVTGAFSPSVSVSTIEDDKELFRVKSFWMLDLFPNELIIRQKTLHVIIRDFLTSNIETMMLDDVGLVQVNNGILFSSLIIRYRIPHEDLQIAKIPKAQATQAKAILDSLLVSKKTKKSDDIELVGEMPQT